MLTYDVTDIESFQNLNSWFFEIKNKYKNVYKELTAHYDKFF